MRRLIDSLNKLAGVIAKRLASYSRLKAILRVPWRPYVLARLFARWFIRFVRRKRGEYLVSHLPSRIQAIECQVKQIESLSPASEQPIVFFTASTTGISFWMLAWLATSWGLRLAGERVVNFVCHGGLSRCALGTNYRFPEAAPPCESCQRNSDILFDAESTVRFGPMPDSARSLLPSLQRVEFPQLENYCYNGIEVGRLCLPSLRWALRRHSVEGDDSARRLYAHYLASAVGLVDSFCKFIDQVQPKVVVAFNGTFFPEAVARQVALSRGIPVVTYEVGHRDSSISLSHGVATEYAVDLPAEYQLTLSEEDEFGRYFARRVAGRDCSMGGVKFWPTMTALSEDLVSKADSFRQVVSVFTNVAFDTSQASANTVFSSMFEWLEETLKLAQDWPDTLFVLRAHPAEARPGKESREPVQDWLVERGFVSMNNLLFIPPTQDVSSYELIQLSKICLVYNSTIGLEATILGTPVICAGTTKYSREGVAYTVDIKDEYRQLLQQFLSSDRLEVAAEWREKARRFLYYLVFKNSLDFSRFIEKAGPGYGYVLKRFRATELSPDQSQEMRIIHDGIVNGSDFCYG